VAKIYKASGVNPVAGCLPMLIQMPILFAIYYGVRDMVYEGPANFLWMSNIATDVKNTEYPFIMPILSALTTYIASKQTMADNNSMQNQMMLYFMPLMIGYMSWQFSGGLVIYWVVMNIMQIAQQTYMAHMENKAKAAAMAPKATVPAPEKSDKKAKNQKK
jgi:YidC/Oxa1 family membrane protein insertase